MKVSLARGRFAGELLKMNSFDTNEVIVVPLMTDRCGLLIIGIQEDKVLSVWRLEGGDITAISCSTAFKDAKNHPHTYNCYFEGGQLKVQNKVGNDKTLRVSLYGL